MKYLVNRETKEHYIQPGMMVPYGPQYDEVEADADGWIPWNGGECPLPPDGECVVKDRHTLTRGCGGDFSWRHEESNAHGSEWNIIAYRPILADKEEAQPKSILGPDFDFTSTEKMPYSAHSPSVFDRLKSAIAASESIPDIIAEIDAMLPEGYCVVKRGAEQPAEHPAEGMTDWRNWREGDLVTVHGNKGHYSDEDYKDGKTYRVVEVCAHGLEIGSERRDSLFFSEDEIDEGQLRYHSRPAKAAG